MDQVSYAEDTRQADLFGWRFNETVELQRERQELSDERQNLVEQRRELEQMHKTVAQEREELDRRIAWEDQRMEREKQLFEMKLRILEEELANLATEKQRFEQQKAFYNRVQEFEKQRDTQEPQVVRGEMFFVGVENKTSLKKRYKELIKIYHPDNADGDNSTIQEINNEYQKLCTALEA